MYVSLNVVQLLSKILIDDKTSDAWGGYNCPGPINRPTDIAHAPTQLKISVLEHLRRARSSADSAFSIRNPSRHFFSVELVLAFAFALVGITQHCKTIVSFFLSPLAWPSAHRSFDPTGGASLRLLRAAERATRSKQRCRRPFRWTSIACPMSRCPMRPVKSFHPSSQAWFFQHLG